MEIEINNWPEPEDVAPFSAVVEEGSRSTRERPVKVVES